MNQDSQLEVTNLIPNPIGNLKKMVILSRFDPLPLIEALKSNTTLEHVDIQLDEMDSSAADLLLKDWGRTRTSKGFCFAEEFSP